MSAAETIVLIKDLFIIAACGVAIIVFLEVGFVILLVYLKIYPSFRRAARNLEQSSNIILNIFARPLDLVAAIMNVVSRVLGVVENFRSKERRNDDDQDQ